MSAGRKVNQATIEKIVRLAASGLPQRRIAERFGLDVATIRKLTKKYMAKKLDPESIEKIVLLRSMGLTHRMIAARLGVHQSTISEALVRAGVAPKLDGKPMCAAPAGARKQKSRRQQNGKF